VTRAITDVVDLQIDLITPSRELMDKATEDAYARALGELMEIVVYTSDKKFYEKAKLSGRRTHRP